MSDYLYRSKPTFVEAIQWTGDNWEEIWAIGPGEKIASTALDSRTATPDEIRDHNGHPLQLLAGKDGAQGWVDVPVGHWLVRLVGDDSDIWPVADEYFREKYEEAGPK